MAGNEQYALLDRCALAGIDPADKIKTVKVEDDGRLKISTVDLDTLIHTNTHTNANEIRVFSASHICDENSSIIPLGSNEVFTGAWQDTLNYSEIIIGINTDKNSAVDGLDVQWSSNGTDIDDHDKFSLTANAGKVFTFPPARRYVRIVYTNGAIAQELFRLQTQLKRFATRGSSHRISDSIVSDDDAILTKSIITGRNDSGIYNNVMIDQAGNLKVNSLPYTYAIAESDILNHYSLLKFGTRSSVLANTNSLVWEGTNPDYTYLTSGEQLKVSSSSAQDGVGGTGILTLTLIGLDSNFLEISEVITMNGITAVTTTNYFIRVFRAYGSTSGTSLTNVGLITITNNAGTNQLLVIPAGDGQTLMTMWTVPAGKVAYITTITFSTDTNKGARTSIRTRLNDGGTLYPWQIKYRAYVFQGNNNFPFQIPFKISEKTDIEVRVLTPASAGTTSAGATFELWYENA